MRHGLVGIATVAILICAGTAHAQLVYSFESPPIGNTDGFGPNGGGTYTQDTIGTTQGANSLKVDLALNDTFVGALTGNLHPAINNPPGVDFVLLDLTIAQGQEFTGGGFAVMGVTIFGCTQGGACGNSVQFNDIEHIDGKAAGLYSDVRFDLNSAANFLPGQSFNQIFGLSGSGSPLIPTHFQLFFNKSNNPGNVMTVYIDNIRVAPEPATWGLFSLGAVVMGMIRRRSRR
jgi:hypothetical protein